MSATFKSRSANPALTIAPSLSSSPRETCQTLVLCEFANWTEDDAYVLNREVDMIKYIRAHTTAPVLHIVHHSSDHDNELGYLFILMAELPGKGAQSVWFEQPYDGEAFMLADVPPMAV